MKHELQMKSIIEREGPWELPITAPDRANRVFVAETFGNSRTGSICVIPLAMIERRSHCPAAGHFEIAVRVGLPDPVPGVLKPIGAVLFSLLREPGNLVVTPDPIASLSSLPGVCADAPVIEFHQIRQVFALPAAVRSSSLAAEENAVKITNLEDRLLRMAGNLLDSQWKCMKVEQELAVAHQAAARHVRIAEHHAAARMLLGIGANQSKDASIVRKVLIVFIHDFHLAPVNALEAQIDIRHRQKSRTITEFQSGSHRGFRRQAPNLAFVAPWGRGWLHGGNSVSLLADPSAANAQSGTGICSTSVVTISKMQASRIIVGVACVNQWKLLLRPCKILQQISLATPQTNAPSNVFCSDLAEHAYVVAEIASAVKQALHRNRTGKIVVQYLTRHGPLKVICAGARGLSFAERILRQREGRQCKRRSKESPSIHEPSKMKTSQLQNWKWQVRLPSQSCEGCIPTITLRQVDPGYNVMPRF